MAREFKSIGVTFDGNNALRTNFYGMKAGQDSRGQEDSVTFGSSLYVRTSY